MAIFDEVRGLLAETRPAFEQVRKDRMIELDRVEKVRPRIQADVEVLRVHDHVLDGSADTVHIARHNPHPYASTGFDLRDLACFDLPVSRVHHLVRLRQVHPELEAAHAVLVDLRHLLVDDPAPGRHPLDVTGADDPLVPRLSSCSTRPSSMYV